LQRNPGLTTALYYRAFCYFKGGDSTRSIADYDRYINLQSGDADGYYWRGYVRRKVGEVEESDADFRRVLDYSNDPKLRAAVQEILQPVQV
jgi:tetratricopeptide (TPR) repeat protein